MKEVLFVQKISNTRPFLVGLVWTISGRSVSPQLKSLVIIRLDLKKNKFGTGNFADHQVGANPLPGGL